MSIVAVSNGESGASVRSKINSAFTQLNDIAAIKVYRAALTQAGTAAPTATVLENTFAGTLTWSRTGAGSYELTSGSNEFTSNKTFFVAYQNSAAGTQFADVGYVSVSVLALETGIVGVGLSDGVLDLGMIEIRVYP